MTGEEQVPFDDLFACMPPAWYENPRYGWIAIASVGMCVGCWYLWRLYAQRSQGKGKACPEKRIPQPSAWYAAIQEADVAVQRNMYADWLQYTKYAIQQWHHISGQALTDTQLVQWGWYNLPQAQAHALEQFVYRAQQVRFEGRACEQDTMYHDYMIVNELASYMQNGTSYNTSKNTS